MWFTQIFSFIIQVQNLCLRFWGSSILHNHNSEWRIYNKIYPIYHTFYSNSQLDLFVHHLLPLSYGHHCFLILLRTIVIAFFVMQTILLNFFFIFLLFHLTVSLMVDLLLVKLIWSSLDSLRGGDWEWYDFCTLAP